ncbi:MAG: NTPase [Patescibacteria group bacterium]|nr:MAG: NTPase [Patescibacteria group bacterium]
MIQFVTLNDVMHIFVGSHNPVKINSVVGAVSETWPDAIVEGFDVPSGINEQPMGDQETKQGAMNRAQATLYDGLAKYEVDGFEFDPEEVLGVGLEGGVFEDPEGQMWSTVWAVVVDKNGLMEFANGARFKVPDIVAEQIRAGGEMGPIISSVVGESDVRKKQGMIGITTKGFVDRTEEYQALAKLAIGLWYGRDWLKDYNYKE